MIFLVKKPSNAVVELVNFMSDQFDSFGQQLKELISSVKEFKIEIKKIKEENEL